MGFGIGLDIPRTPAVCSLRGARRDSCKIQRENAKNGKAPASRLSIFFGAFSKFRRIAGLTSRGDTDLRIVGIEAVAWPNAFQRPIRQAGGIAASFSGWREFLISDKNLDAQGRLFARYFRAAVSSGLSWGGLLNTSPSTLALMGECLIWSAEKSKTRGKSEVIPRAGEYLALFRKRS